MKNEYFEDVYEVIKKAFLVGVVFPGGEKEEEEEHIKELELLVKNLGMEIAGKEIVKLRKPKSKYLIGSGKADEIVQQSRIASADVIVFDEDLTPSQQRNWETISDSYVIDRSEVILEVFFQRAQTNEAQLQIELAREKYALPRLTNAWTHLSRQHGGGTGQRGEGEKQIELDRRMISKSIHRLELELENVRKHRDTQRKRRKTSSKPNAAVVGYTNAGKSTLLNALTGAGVEVADKLFATLDPTTRALLLPNNQKIFLTDTVGFIRKLPHLLVESFKATLEEAVVSDIIIHVVDVSGSNVIEHFDATVSVLEEIGAQEKRFVRVFNKVDLIDDELKRAYIRNKYPDAVFTSFKTGEGIEQLKERIVEVLAENLAVVELMIPHSRSDIVSLLYETSNIQSKEYGNDGVVMTASVPYSIYKEVSDFVVSNHSPDHS